MLVASGYTEQDFRYFNYSVLWQTQPEDTAT
jgi:hypothetical protein